MLLSNKLRGVFGNFDGKTSLDGKLTFLVKNQITSVPVLRMRFEKADAYLVSFAPFPIGYREPTIMRASWDIFDGLKINIRFPEGAQEITPEQFRDSLTDSDLPIIVVLPRYPEVISGYFIERAVRKLLSDLIKKEKVYLI